MRFAYADPPYPGQSKRHYEDHPDYAGEVDHGELARRLRDEFDGWVLHTSSVALFDVQRALHEADVGTYRTMAWVKPFCAFKRNVSVAYAWEPVLIQPMRKPTVTGRVVMRDFISESITMKKGLTGVKPEVVCRWAFEVAGAEPTDEMFDLYPGTGAVTTAWHAWVAERQEEAA